MKRRNFFKFLGLSAAAPTAIAKAVGELKKTAKDNVVKIDTSSEDITITTPFGKQFKQTTVSGRGPTFVHPGDMDVIYLKENKFQEGDHIYNENGFYIMSESGPVLIGKMFEEGKGRPAIF